MGCEKDLNTPLAQNQPDETKSVIRAYPWKNHKPLPVSILAWIGAVRGLWEIISKMETGFILLYVITMANLLLSNISID